jgi:hypothetical protein
MPLDASYWQSLAADYLTAWAQAFPSAGGMASEPSHRWAIELAMAVAQHETSNSLAWPGSWNFGAVQLRGLTAAEMAAFQAGTLKAGDYLPGHTGVLHVDTHPPGIPYPVWFYAAPTRVDGIVHFLSTLYRLTAGEIANDAATAASVAQAMYVHHYFEGRHVDDRKWQAARELPLSAPEQENVDEYAGAIQKCLDMVVPMLTAWPYGLDPAAGVTSDGGPTV